MSRDWAGLGDVWQVAAALRRVLRWITEAPAGPAAVAVCLAVFAFAEVVARSASLHGNPVLAQLLTLCTTLPLAFVLAPDRPQPLPGQRPVAAVALTAACLLALGPFQALTLAGAGAQMTVVYLLGRSGAPWITGLLVLPYVVLALVSNESTPRTVAILLATLGSAAAVAGISGRARSAAAVQSATEAAFADTLLEHAARGERARIARELHDVVAHHLSMISVQAETARLTTPGMPEDGAKRLLAIGDTARAALTEMRRLLGVLREDASDAGAQVADRRPQPGLRQLVELLDEAREAAGSAARLIVSGPVAPLDPGVELIAYRVVQEALTNARRHAPGAAVDVELRYGADALELRIRDNGPGPAPAGPGGGHGLVGMRERAATVGGELRTGPAPGAGFLVEARLPGTAEGVA